MTRLARIALLAALIGALGGSPARAEPDEFPQPLPMPFEISLIAQVENHLIDRVGHISKSSVRIYRRGNTVRTENHTSIPVEISIVDYDRLWEYRIYDSDGIFFQQQVSESVYGRAWREGIVDARFQSVEETKLVLGEDVFDGHPTEIILRIRSFKDRIDGPKEYTLVWEAKDLDRLPVRVAYHQSNNAVAVVEYRDIRFEGFDDTLLRVPGDYLNMSPY